METNVIPREFGQHIITGFNIDNDKIDLTAYGSALSLDITQKNGDVIINLTPFGSGNVILEDVDILELTLNNFEGVSSLKVVNAGSVTWDVVAENTITVTDTSGVVETRGTAGNDIISSPNGVADDIYGLSGDDIIHGGASNDLIWGGDGNDIIYSGGNNAGKKDRDALYGGEGNDTLYGDAQKESLYGDGGNDTLYGRGGNDMLYGGAGNDTLNGGSGSDMFSGGSGSDTFVFRAAEGGNDVVDDFGRNDTIVIEDLWSPTLILTKMVGKDEYIIDFNVNTVPWGAGGKITLKNVDFTPTVNQFPGVDDIHIMEHDTGGLKELFGTSAADTFTISKLLGQNVILSFNPNNDKVDLSAYGSDLDIEIAQKGDAVFVNMTTLRNGNVILEGVSVDDLDTSNFVGVASLTIVDAREVGWDIRVEKVVHGNPYYSYQQLYDVANISELTDGKSGEDRIQGRGGNDILFGGSHKDSIWGGSGSDVMYGEEGNDLIHATDGEWESASEVNEFYGGPGNDKLYSGNATDHMTGGAGRDTFVIRRHDKHSGFPDQGHTIIHDFDPDHDTIYLEALGGKGGGYTEPSVPVLVLKQEGDDIVIDLDVWDSDYVTYSDTTNHRYQYGLDMGKLTLKSTSFSELRADHFPGVDEIVLYGSEEWGVSGPIDRTIIGRNVAKEVPRYGYVFDDIQSGNGDDTIHLRAGDDKAYGNGGNDNIHGDAGHDTLYGGEGDDTLYGGHGNDTLNGGPGTNVLHDDKGATKFIYDMVGEGVDTIVGFSRLDDTLEIKGLDAMNLVAEQVGDDVVIDMTDNGGSAGRITLQDVSLAELSADQFVGVSTLNGETPPTKDPNAPPPTEDQYIYGGAGNDVLRGGAGNDYIEGGSDGSDTIYGGEGNDIIRGGEGYSGSDKLYGEGGNDDILGGGGHDVIYGGDGNDVIHGGAHGYDIIYGGAGDDVIRGGEEFSSGSPYTQGDTIYGGEGNDWINGGGQADTMYGGSGVNTLIGGPGPDTFVYVMSDEGVDTINEFSFEEGPYDGGWWYGDYLKIEGLSSAELVVHQLWDRLVINMSENGGTAGSITLRSITEGEATADRFVGVDTLIYAEQPSNLVEGTDGDDELLGDNDNNVISGYAGNDTIRAYHGDDVIDGGVGDDSIYAGGGGDVVHAGDGDDYVEGGNEQPEASGDVINGGAGNDVLDGEGGTDTLHGGTGKNTLTGGDNADTFVYDMAQEGDDTITDFSSEDTLEVQGLSGTEVAVKESGSDVVIAMSDNGGTTGTITLQDVSFSALDASQFEGVDTLTLLPGTPLQPPPEGFDLQGTNADDTLTGGAGDDIVGRSGGHGGVGNDAMYGDAGDDSVDGGAGDDTVSGGSGTNTVTGGSGADTFVYVLSEEGVDTFTDFSSEDVLEIQGITGTELVLRQDGDHVVIDMTDNGGAAGAITLRDTSLGDLSASQFVGIDTLVDGNASPPSPPTPVPSPPTPVPDDPENIRSGHGNDHVVTGSGNDTIRAQKGDDVIDAGAGDDYIVAGKGDDTITGGEGADTHWYGTAGAGDDVILDFAVGEDVIQLHGFGLDYAALSALFETNVDGDAVIHLPHPGNSSLDATITLTDVAVAELSAGDFLL